MKLGLMLVLLCAAGHTWAQSPVVDRIKGKGAITLGYIDGAAPFSMKGPDGGPQGYSVDLCRAVAEGVRIEFGLPKLDVRWSQLTLQNRVDEVLAGRVDLECSTTTWTFSRQRRIDFSLITFIDGVTVVSKRETGLLNFPDFAGRRIAVIDGTTAGPVLHDALGRRGIEAEVVTVKSREEGLKLLEGGDVQGRLASDRIALIGTAVATPNRELLQAPRRGSFAGAVCARDAARRSRFPHRGESRARASLPHGDIVAIYNRWLAPLGPPSVLLSAAYFVQSLSE